MAFVRVFTTCDLNLSHVSKIFGHMAKKNFLHSRIFNVINSKTARFELRYRRRGKEQWRVSGERQATEEGLWSGLCGV